MVFIMTSRMLQVKQDLMATVRDRVWGEKTEQMSADKREEARQVKCSVDDEQLWSGARVLSAVSHPAVNLMRLADSDTPASPRSTTAAS